jgi:carbohydrate diacid regulator
MSQPVPEPALTPALSPALAQEIAGETSTIIGLNVLITDTAGVVIGSGDRSRLGSVHEASIDVLRTGRPASHTAEQARALTGVRPGITLPVVIDGAVLGTVGLTGAPRRVRQFGLVVQRQTEILLRESMLLRSRLLREQAVEDLVRDIALFDASVTSAGAVAARVTELGIAPGLPRVAVLVAVGQPAGPRPVLPSTASPLRSVREVFHDPHDLVGEMSAGRIAVLHRTASPGGGSAGEPLRRRCERVTELFARRHGLTALVGYGPAATGVAELHESYRDASAALRVGPAARPDQRVFPITELRVHQLVATAAPGTRDRFVAAELGALPEDPAWPALRDTLLAWGDSGFNLVRAAVALRIHRNTLLHRLDKITKLTGSPARQPRGGIALYLACVAEQVGRAAE